MWAAGVRSHKTKFKQVVLGGEASPWMTNAMELGRMDTLQDQQMAVVQLVEFGRSMSR